MRLEFLSALLVGGTVAIAVPSAAFARWPLGPNEMPDCAFPNGDRTSLRELLSSIDRNGPACGLPWRALKHVAQKPEHRKALEDAYTALAQAYPDHASAARARRADVSAAAGDPTEMLKIADDNVVAHPDDKSLPNVQCFFRSARGFDREHVLAICDAAVAADRKPYTLVYRGKAKLALGMFDKALGDFEEALRDPSFRKHPALVEAVYGRGIARLKLGDRGGQRDVDAAKSARASVVDDFADAGISLQATTL